MSSKFPFPEEITNEVQEDLYKWFHGIFIDGTSNLSDSSENLLKDLSNGELLWKLVLKFSPDYENKKTQNNTEFDCIRLWSFTVLGIDKLAAIDPFSFNAQTPFEKVSVLDRLLEITRKLSYHEQFLLVPPRIVQLEQIADTLFKTTKESEKKNPPSKTDEVPYVPTKNDPIDEFVGSQISLFCPKLPIRRIQSGMYSAKRSGYFSVHEYTSEFCLIRFDQRWFMPSYFFSSLIGRSSKAVSVKLLSMTSPALPKPELRSDTGFGIGSITVTQPDEPLHSPTNANFSKSRHSFSGDVRFMQQPRHSFVLATARVARKVGQFVRHSESAKNIPESLLYSPVLEGEWLQKVELKGKTNRYFFKIFGNTPDTYALTWSETQAATILNSYLGRNYVKIQEVTEIRNGQRTTIFGHRFYTEEEDVLSFSVIHQKAGFPIETVDIICSSEQEKAVWVDDLRKLVAIANKYKNIKTKSILEEKWYQLYPDATIITKNQLRKLFKSLHIRISNRDIVNLMNYYDSNHNQKWDFEEFEQMVVDFETNIRSEILPVISKFTGGKAYFTVLEFYSFLLSCQREDLSWEQVVSILEEFEGPLSNYASAPKGLFTARISRSATLKSMSPRTLMSVVTTTNRDNTKPKGEKIPISKISTLAFVRYLKADENQLYDKSGDVDLNRPLNEYFIASSHNTYLIGSQYFDDSSVGAYIDTIRAGARCIEIDLHDGSSGEYTIVVKHGGAGTTVVSFDAVCRAINEVAFEDKNRTPIIISLENHCSQENQKIVAARFREIFGERLLLPSFEANDKTLQRLPSPKELFDKIILKGKITKSMQNQSEETSELGPRPSRAWSFSVQRRKSKRISRGLLINKTTVLMLARGKLTRRTSERKGVIDSELVAVLYLRSLKIKSDLKFLANAIERGNARNMTSFPDNIIDNFLTDPKAYVTYNTKIMSRVYPNPVSPKSWISANFSPIKTWMVGVQCAALNYQTFDIPMQINDAFFQQNGGFGYVPKPDFLLDPDNPFDFNNATNDKRLSPISLKVHIISGQHFQFPKPTHNSIDPYVVVQVIGIPIDKKAGATHVVAENGFNPVWDESFEFSIQCPELAFLHFQVIDKDETIQNTIMAYYCIPVTRIKPGYRHIPLKRVSDGQIVGPHCSLFCYIQRDRLFR